MGAINNAYNQAGWSILQLASAASKYISERNKEGQNRAKQSYNWAATIKKQNNELTQNQVETTKSYFNADWNIPPEKDEQKIAEQNALKEIAQEKAKATNFGELIHVEDVLAPEQKVLEQMVQEKAKATSFGELPTVSAENTETNISAEDPEVQGLIEVKQKNALRAVAGQRSQERYQNIKQKLTGTFADASNIDDVWRYISLDPDITDEMIKKAGFTKTQILEEWKWFNNSPTDWMQKQNIRGEEYGVIGSEAEAEDFSNFDFGGTLSDYIRAKAGGKTLAQQLEEYELSKAEKEPEEENYKVWQDESTEEEKDEIKKDRDFSGMFKFLQDESTKEESTKEEKEKEKEKDEVKTDRNFSGIKF